MPAQAQFNADQLLTQREQVSSQARRCRRCRWCRVGQRRTVLVFLSHRVPATAPRQVRNALLKRSADFGIVLEDVALTHLSFSAEYARAIEFKQAWLAPCPGVSEASLLPLSSRLCS